MGPLNVQHQQLAAPETLTNHRGIIQLRNTELDLNDLIQLHSVFADDYISLWFLIRFFFRSNFIFLNCVDTEIVLLLFKSF